MSNYKILGGQDLDAIFMPISTAGATGAQYATNFIASGGDLQLRYAKYVSGLKVPDTLYVATQHYGTDLSQIFQNIAVPLTPYIINSGPSPGENISGTLYTLTFNPNATNCSITFLANLTLTNMIIIGGGGGGRQSCLSSSNYYAGAGGGGSSFLKDGSMSVLSNTTYTYSVGSAGAGGISNTTTIANVGIQTYIHDAIGNNIVTCPGGKASTSTNTTYSEHYWSGSGGSNSTTYDVSITGATTGTGGGSPPGGGYKSGITRTNGGNGYNASVIPYSGGGGSVVMDVFSSGFIACLPGICGNGNIGGTGGASTIVAHTTYNAVDAISSNYGVGGGGGGGVFPSGGSTPAQYGSGGAGGPGVIQIQFNYP
jgi:hypothetical protein